MPAIQRWRRLACPNSRSSCTCIDAVFELQAEEFQSILDENIVHIEQTVQQAAGRSLHDFLLAYGRASDSNQVVKYCQGLFHSDSASVRVGSAHALAAVPRRLLAPLWQEALAQVCKACRVDEAVVKRDAEARVEAIKVRIPCMPVIVYRPFNHLQPPTAPTTK